MKNGLIITALILVGLAIAGYAYKSELRFAMMMMTIKPKADFAQTQSPPVPDYALPASWAALPEREDLADVLPAGDYFDAQASAEVDVFFIHPTTYFGADSWNQPIADQAVNAFTDKTVMRGQASAFNGCCRVFAPRYRQATFASFMDLEGSGGQALELAYEDVAAAFRNFIETKNQGRPFIIAGHSQGSLHADKLLKQEIVGQPVAARMIAAYPIGFAIDGSNGLPVCASAQDTGCQVSWNSVGASPDSVLSKSDSICVNPLSWRIDSAVVANENNLGAVSFSVAGVPEPGAADAQCSDGLLKVVNITSENFGSRPLGVDNLHVYDYSLFYMNIRQNAQRRVQAWTAAHSL